MSVTCYDFLNKRAHDARDLSISLFLFQNVQNEISGVFNSKSF